MIGKVVSIAKRREEQPDNKVVIIKTTNTIRIMLQYYQNEKNHTNILT